MNRGPDGRLVGFADLKAHQFPVTLTAFADGKQIWERVIEPYVVVSIPAATPEQVGKVRIRAVFGDGRVVWQEPLSAEEARQHLDRLDRE